MRERERENKGIDKLWMRERREGEESEERGRGREGERENLL